MMYERYRGRFYSLKNVRWEVSILQDGDAAFSTVGALRFPFEEPLLIEWAETAKEDVICGSTATLTLLSPGDRTYEDLYTIEVGRIRLDVYHDGLLYWSGVLDPEFYEEPYIVNSNYEVTLTFSDFGILDRLKYDLSGVRTLENILLYSLSRSRLLYTELNQDYLSTCLQGSVRATLGKLSIRSDNFYDEDGEASSLYEVVEGILCPLGLRLIQKNGKIWVYDLNGIYCGAPAQKVYWMGDDQVMGVDKVANNAKIKFSTYSDAEILSPEVVYTDSYSIDQVNLASGHPTDGEYYSYYPDYSDDSKLDGEWDYPLLSFTIFLSNQGEGLAEKYAGARYFHILPLMGGQEADGIAYSLCGGNHASLTNGWHWWKLNSPATKSQTILMRTYRAMVPALEEAERKNYYIRLSLEMLMDARYNPFSEAGSGNEGNNYNTLKVCCGYVMVPATVTLYDEEGNALMHYSNEAIAQSNDRIGAMWYVKGEWKSGAPTYGSCWLSWYDPADRKENAGVQGWKKNRQNIGLSTQGIYKSFAGMEGGQYMPYPSRAGYLEVCIYTGVWAYDYKEKNFGNTPTADKKKLYEKIRWLLYKAPRIDIVRQNTVYSDAESDDIEYTGYINRGAKEDIEIETICGTMAEVCPTAKGLLFRSDNGQQIKVLTRGGRTTQAEQLLIGTLYSQYAGRKTKLAGTAAVAVGDLCLYTDAMQGGKKFLSLSDIQNVKSDESEILIVELRPDEYKSENEK